MRIRYLSRKSKLISEVLCNTLHNSNSAKGVRVPCNAACLKK